MIKKKLNILVTGAAGFIGSNLTRLLLRQDHNVINIDNFDDFYDPEYKRRNIGDQLFDPSYTFYQSDIRDATAINGIFEKHEIDLVIHLAGLAGVRASIEFPERYMAVNVQGTLNILRACHEHKVKKLIFGSSSSVYGQRNEVAPLVEDMATNSMISPYAITKKSAEDFCFYFHQQYGIDVIALRFFTVYGPAQRPDLAIHKFTHLISEGKEIPVYGNGESLRDYTYVDDIVNGIISAKDLLQHSSRIFEVINLSGNQAIYLKDVVSELETALGITAIIKKLPPQAGDVFFTRADLGKAKRLLNYHPGTSFKQGIQNFVNWYKQINNVVAI